MHASNDFIKHLAADILDIAVRCHFTKAGLDAVEAKLRKVYEQNVESISPYTLAGPPEYSSVLQYYPQFSRSDKSPSPELVAAFEAGLEKAGVKKPGRKPRA